MSYLFDSFNRGLADSFIESRLEVRNAAGGRGGYIHQGIEKVPNENARWVDDTWNYRYPEDAWVRRASPTGRVLGNTRTEMESPAVGGAAYSMGGLNRGKPASVRRYKPDHWTAMQHGPVSMSDGSFQTYEEKIYGWIINSKAQRRNEKNFYEYNPQKDRWTARLELVNVASLLFVHSATLGERGYYFGGTSQPGGEKGVATDLHRDYCAPQDTSNELTPMIEPIDSGTTGALDGWVFLMGGAGRGRVVTGATRAYNPKEESWAVWKGNQNQAAPMPDVRSSPASFTLPQAGSIFVTGGAVLRGQVEQTRNTNFRFEVKTDTWETMTELLPSRRFKHGAFSL